ncbi:MAG TPA: flagellar basal-body MS-ring/collar protein FliF, partial [Nitrospiraceae bacterium]|nr:flagellar basal-body MS-ring/collar protein FliF [Nitrospiraceae bacterium]
MLTKFNSLPIGKRLGILVALAAGVAALVSVTLWTQQPDMQVLFANLATEDAGAIVEKLKEAKVPYELGASGASILVPSAQVHDLRLQMAGQGLPHGGGVGFEIFDRSTLGMSEFVQKLNYRRALQGELARTITQMPDVARARVHLAVPERRLFSAEHDRPRASVVLSLRGSNALSRGQIQGIVHLVASSVEGLQPRDVTVVDGNGRLLSEGSNGGEGPTRLTGSQLDYQRTLEKDLETRIQTMLERIVGNNKAVVRVSSVLDLRQVEMTEERYDPNGQVARSEQRTQEKANGSNGVSGGVPGVASNVPPGQAQEPAQTSSTNTANKNEVINYEISRTVAKIIEPTGTIKQLSVAVLVDGTYEPVKEGGAADAVRKYVPRPEAEMKQIEEIVKKAMGYSADRQDQVEVVNVQFGFEGDVGAGSATAAEEAPSLLKTYTPYIRYGVGAALFLLILVFVVRPLVTALTAPSAASSMQER